VPEQLALEQVGRDGRTVHLDERIASAGTAVVQGAGEKLLPGSRLAADKDGEIAERRHPRGLVQRLPQRRTGAQDRLETRRTALGIGKSSGFVPARRLAGEPLQAAAQQIGVVGKGEVVARTALQRRGRDPVVGRRADEVAGDRAARFGEKVERLGLGAAPEQQDDVGGRSRLVGARLRRRGRAPQLLHHAGHRGPEAVGEEGQLDPPFSLRHILRSSSAISPSRLASCGSARWKGNRRAVRWSPVRCCGTRISGQHPGSLNAGVASFRCSCIAPFQRRAPTFVPAPVLPERERHPM
jgi:hypothetical protein